MGNLIERLVESAHRFTVVDFAIFKICLLSIGVLLGSYFGGFLMEYISVIWAVAIATCVAIVIATVRYFRKGDTD